MTPASPAAREGLRAHGDRGDDVEQGPAGSQRTTTRATRAAEGLPELESWVRAVDHESLAVALPAPRGLVKRTRALC
ncbi:hypothetical protein [Dactylosporangium darangshiense]|uniref:Uncharacterized protein n=1 Tax=Dactylosporangium darangshiense TaxID=579108 RepID=A0ABP8D7N2_9ACTN